MVTVLTGNGQRRAKMLRKKFQRFEVVCGSETLKCFAKTREAAALDFARISSESTIRSVSVDAISQNGSTGQHTSQIACFVSGQRV